MLVGITSFLMVMLLAGFIGVIKLTSILGSAAYLLFAVIVFIIAIIGFHLWTRYRETESSQQVADLIKEVLTTPLEKKESGDSQYAVAAVTPEGKIDPRLTKYMTRIEPSVTSIANFFKDFLTPRRIKRILWYAVYMLVVLIVQDMVLTQIRPLGVCAFIPPAAAAAVGMFEGAIPGVVFGLVLGIFTDMFTPGTVIAYTLLFPLIAFGVGFISQFFLNRRFMGFMLSALAALLLTAFVQVLVTALGSGGALSAIGTAILQTLWSLPVSVLCYFPPAKWIE